MTEIRTNIVPFSHAVIRRTAQAAGSGTNTGDNRHTGQPPATAQAVRKNSQNSDRRKTDRRGSARSIAHPAKVTTRYASTFAAQVAGQWYAQSDAAGTNTEHRLNACQAANDAYRTRTERPHHLALVDIEN